MHLEHRNHVQSVGRGRRGERMHAPGASPSKTTWHDCATRTPRSSPQSAGAPVGKRGGRRGERRHAGPEQRRGGGRTEALCWAHRIEERLAGGCASEAAEDGRVEGCDRSIHIGIVHLWGEGAVMSTCMRRIGPHWYCPHATSGMQSALISHNQACNQRSSGTQSGTQSAHLRQQALVGILGERALW